MKPEGGGARRRRPTVHLLLTLMHLLEQIFHLLNVLSPGLLCKLGRLSSATSKIRRGQVRSGSALFGRLWLHTAFIEAKTFTLSAW